MSDSTMPVQKDVQQIAQADSATTRGTSVGSRDSTAQSSDSARVPAVVGRVEQLGVAPASMLVVRPDSGGPVSVRGALSAEIQRLTAARVALFGSIRLGGTWPEIEPDRYEILEIDGQRPWVGVLTAEGSRVWLRAERTYELTGVPDALRSQAGAKVFILGNISGNKIAVLSFGVIVPKS